MQRAGEQLWGLLRTKEQEPWPWGPRRLQGKGLVCSFPFSGTLLPPQLASAPPGYSQASTPSSWEDDLLIPRRPSFSTGARWKIDTEPLCLKKAPPETQRQLPDFLPGGSGGVRSLRQEVQEVQNYRK